MPTNFHFVTAVWGPTYTELFVQMALPNQLTPGNLLALQNSEKSIYRVFTSSLDAQQIRSSVAWEKLIEFMPAEIVLIDDLLENACELNKYATMTAAHKRAIAKAVDDKDTAFVFLAPDAVFSEGSLKSIFRLVRDEGKSAIMVAGLRVVQETILPAMLKKAQAEGNRLLLPCSELLTLAIDHMHPTYKSMFWSHPNFTVWPSNIFWKAGTTGFIARCFHMHPLVVKPQRRDVLPINSIDGYYLDQACPDKIKIHVVRDATEILIVSPTPARHVDGLPMNDGTLVPHVASVEEVATWMGSNTDGQHREFVKDSICFVREEQPQTFLETELEADRVINRCLAQFEKLETAKILRRLANERTSLEERVIELEKSRSALENLCQGLEQKIDDLKTQSARQIEQLKNSVDLTAQLEEEYKTKVQDLQAQKHAIYKSTTWKLGRLITKPAHLLRKRV